MRKREKFPLIEISGEPWQRGVQLGEAIPGRIRDTVEFYKSVFNRKEEEIFTHARHFKHRITEFSPEYAREIEGIAKGADLDPLWIYALNARSEILTMFISECSALYASSSRILAQTWDWAERMEELAIVLRIRKPTNSIIMMTEPGIIGKIGMNASGIGVTLNFLSVEHALDGVPIHIVLRAMLDSASLEEIARKIDMINGGQAGNIIVGTKQGRFVNYEFTGKEIGITSDITNNYHTNHYLNYPDLNTREEKLQSSYARYQRLSELVPDRKLALDEIKKIFVDQEYDLPICRPYLEDPDIGNTGTICAIIMDLANGRFSVSSGNPKVNPYLDYYI